MDLQPSQLNDDQKSYLIRSINDRLEKTVQFAKTIDWEAGRSSGNKRLSRWITGICGGLVTLAGIALTSLGTGDINIGKSTIKAEDMKKGIGIISAVVGAVVVTSGQFIDPAKARQRAIELKTLTLHLENLAEDSQVQCLGLQKDQADTNQLVTLNKVFMDEFLKIQKEAFDLGVDV